MSFYFYDLETSGINSKWQRIMQFGGVRTDEDLNIVDEPYQTLVKLTDEILPEPEAILTTGITPQMTHKDGITEAALAKHLMTEIFTPETISVGFNNIRFDSEFIRSLLYRNYYDPYEREWSDGRSRWDLIDVVRMTRALRPDGIEWPTTKEGKPTNRLEVLTKANKIEHSNAHDALADVMATIEVAKLIKKAQPKLFEHLLSMRDKKIVASLVDPSGSNMIVHTSGRISSDFAQTSIFKPFAVHPSNNNAVLAWDLRHSPENWSKVKSDEIHRLLFSPWKELQAKGESRLPVKAIHLNKSPAVAPIGVLDAASQARINLTIDQAEANLKTLQDHIELLKNIASAHADSKFDPEIDPDGQLYDTFIPDDDKQKFTDIHKMTETQLRDFKPSFSDQRLQDLWIRFKARNFSSTLTDDERQVWEQYRASRLNKGPGMTTRTFMTRLQALAQGEIDNEKYALLEQLQLYAESIAPYDNQQLF